MQRSNDTTTMTSHSASPQPLVTVLTPVYNGERYLAQCIDSVLAQTYKNWEYCIVNNCSTDRTLSIAQAYAARDSRVRVVTNTQFVGRQENHNIAFREMSSNSKYCKVVHADDWLFPECITKMVDLAEANPTVGIVGAYGLSNGHVLWAGLPYQATVIGGRDLCKATLLDGRYVCGTPTSMLFRAEELRRRQAVYNQANQHADHEACFDILREWDFGFVHQVLTYTRVHNGAASSFADRYNTFLHGILEVLSKYGPEFLTSEEYNLQMRRFWKQYYTFLGSKVFRNREKDFWAYHRNELRRLGYSLRVSRVATAAVVEVLELLLNPLNTMIRIATKVRQSAPSTPRAGY